MPDFKVSAVLSARPLEAGWYGADVMWTIPFFLTKVSNSSLVKFGALSEIKLSGTPCCANIALSLQTVAVDVVESMMCVSIHFDVASIATTNILPRNDNRCGYESTAFLAPTKNVVEQRVVTCYAVGMCHTSEPFLPALCPWLATRDNCMRDSSFC